MEKLKAPNITPGPWHIANGTQLRSDKHLIGRINMMRNGEGKRNAEAIATLPEVLKALLPLAQLDLKPGGLDLALENQVVFPREKTIITVGDVKRAKAALIKAGFTED